jgi:hypothetical protein
LIAFRTPQDLALEATALGEGELYGWHDHLAVRMVGEEHLTPNFAKKVQGLRYSNTTPLFTVHLALNERFTGKQPSTNRMSMTTPNNRSHAY